MLNKFFKYASFFITLLFSTIVINNLYAAASAGTGGEEFFSPGKAVSGKIGRQLLVLRPSITEIFGEEKTEEEYGVLFREPARIEAADFRSALSRLERTLKKLVGKGGEHSEQIGGSFVTITRIRFEIGDVPEERMEHYAAEYFGKMEGFERIEFRAKPDGDQLGAKAIVQLAGTPSVFYIKTHSLGHKSISRSSGAHQLDPIEFMVYAILEQLGEGPRVHFFGRDDKTAFIATEDAGEEGAEFKTYEYYLKETTKKEALWGSEVYRYITDTPYGDRDMKTLMRIINADPQSAGLADQFTRMDLISRIFRLSDLIGNTGNFGFTLKPDGSIKLSIIDFRIMSDERGFYTIDNGNLKGFHAGNGIFSSLYADPFVVHVLKDRPAPIRAERVLPHAAEIQGLLPEASEVAIRKVMAFIESVSDKTDDPEKFRSELHRVLMEYREAVLHNTGMYLDYLSRGAPEIS